MMARDGVPPAADGIALAAHGRRQHHVGEGHRRRRHEHVHHHHEIHLVDGVVDARGLARHVRDGVGGLEPYHLDGVGLARLDGLQQAVAVRGGRARREAVEGREVQADALGLHLGRDVLVVPVRVAEHHAVRVARDDVAAWLLDVAADGVHGYPGVRLGDAVDVHVHRDAPLYGAGVALGEQTRGLADVVGGYPRDLRGLFRRPVLDAFHQLVEAVAPACRRSRGRTGLRRR